MPNKREPEQKYGYYLKGCMYDSNYNIDVRSKFQLEDSDELVWGRGVTFSVEDICNLLFSLPEAISKQCSYISDSFPAIAKIVSEKIVQKCCSSSDFSAAFALVKSKMDYLIHSEDGEIEIILKPYYNSETQLSKLIHNLMLKKRSLSLMAQSQILGSLFKKIASECIENEYYQGNEMNEQIEGQEDLFNFTSSSSTSNRETDNNGSEMDETVSNKRSSLRKK